MKTLEEIEDEWVLTLVTGTAQSPNVNLYWFGRLDYADEMAPTKIEATDSKAAWQKLLEQLNAQPGLSEQV